jgi:hypothetical protein
MPWLLVLRQHTDVQEDINCKRPSVENTKNNKYPTDRQTDTKADEIRGMSTALG